MMSLYCIYTGEPGGLLPIMQPLVSNSLINSKLAASEFGGTTPLMYNKVLAPSTLLMPTDVKGNWNNITTSTAYLGSSNQSKTDTSRHFHIFVGDLAPDIETHQLREAFSQFGQTSDCKIIRDQQTLKSKGYGFVSFTNKEDAELAIGSMNGQWLGSRAIRTNWASRKPTSQSLKDGTQKPLLYEEVLLQSSPTNCTVYCGGVASGLTEEIVQKAFNPYGMIQEIRCFKEKGYAFIRFNTKEEASRAIVGVHGSDLLGCTVRCSWGKEPNESPAVSPTQPTFAQISLQTNYCTTPTSVGVQTAYYNQLGTYWSLPPQTFPPLVAPQNGYLSTATAQGVQPTLAPSPTIQPAYTYNGYSRIPSIQWTGTAAAGTGQVLPFTNPQQTTTLLAYPAQTGFQQA